MIGAAFAIASAALTQSCSLPDGWTSVVAQRPRYVVLGEVHGTVESPAFVGQIACALAHSDKTVLVALEQDATADAKLQAIWKLSKAEFATRLGTTLDWQGRDDGNGSVAMKALLLRLHDLALSGAHISVAAFNGMRDKDQARRLKSLPGQGPHEAAQAENIVVAASRGSYDVVLVLVGNVHASLRPVTRDGVRFDPMAMHLRRAGRTTSVSILPGPGTSWSCQLRAGYRPVPGMPVTAKALDCGPHSTGSDLRFDRAPFVSLGPLPDSADPEFRYDGFVWLGPSNASPPALPQ